MSDDDVTPIEVPIPRPATLLQQVPVRCGDHADLGKTGTGCGEMFATAAEAYRCTDCNTWFHRTCARVHFVNSGERRDIERAAAHDELDAKNIALQQRAAQLEHELAAIKAQVAAVRDRCERDRYELEASGGILSASPEYQSGWNAHADMTLHALEAPVGATL